MPSNSLYIEALPGTHPLLEDFKLIHRALDVKKAQAEVRHAELENLRLAARLENVTGRSGHRQGRGGGERSPCDRGCRPVRQSDGRDAQV